MKNRSLVSDVEKDALNNSASRTIFLYFSVSFAVLFICAAIWNQNIILMLLLGLINLVIAGLLFLSFKAKKKSNKNAFFSKSIKIHLFCLFFTSVFVSPFIGIMSLKGFKALLDGTPSGLGFVSAISFGYTALVLVLGIPAMLIISGIRNRQQSKRTVEKKTIEVQKTVLENYDGKKHGKSNEEKGILPNIIGIIGMVFLLFGFLFVAMGIWMAFSPTEDTSMGIILTTVFGLPFPTAGFIMCFVFFKARNDKKSFARITENIYNGERAFVTNAKVISWSRKSILVRGAVKYNSTIGFECKYVFYDNHNKLRKGKGFIKKDSENGVFFSIGVPQAQKQAYPIKEINPNDIRIVFNDKFSAILDAPEK